MTLFRPLLSGLGGHCQVSAVLARDSIHYRGSELAIGMLRPGPPRHVEGTPFPTRPWDAYPRRMWRGCLRSKRWAFAVFQVALNAEQAQSGPGTPTKLAIAPIPQRLAVLCEPASAPGRTVCRHGEV
jgi:hypothetical protein